MSPDISLHLPAGEPTEPYHRALQVVAARQGDTLRIIGQNIELPEHARITGYLLALASTAALQGFAISLCGVAVHVIPQPVAVPRAEQYGRAAA